MNSPISFVPFEYSQLDNFDLRPQESAVMDLEYLGELARGSHCVTLLCDGRPAAILGYVQIWPGVVHVYVVPTIHLAKHPMRYVRLMRRYLGDLEVSPSLNVHRIQTDSIADPFTDKWMRLLGFHCEGVRVRYSADRQDYAMWARLVG